MVTIKAVTDNRLAGILSIGNQLASSVYSQFNPIKKIAGRPFRPLIPITVRFRQTHKIQIFNSIG